MIAQHTLSALLTNPSFSPNRERCHEYSCVSGDQGRPQGEERSDCWDCQRSIDCMGLRKGISRARCRFGCHLLKRVGQKKHVEPLAAALEAPIFVPLDVNTEGQMEQVFERVESEWGYLDFLMHSIAFSPREALHGRVVDIGRDGFLKTMEISCWSFMRMAHLAEPLMKDGGRCSR
jgi:enoyl-[acyl-carrier-protein] reductase (NADH)